MTDELREAVLLVMYLYIDRSKRENPALTPPCGRRMSDTSPKPANLCQVFIGIPCQHHKKDIAN